MASIPILTTIITLKRLAKRGYESMLEHYTEVSLQFNELLYARPVSPKAGCEAHPESVCWRGRLLDWQFRLFVLDKYTKS